MSNFIETDNKWGSRRVIKYKKTHELFLAGKYGEIWQWNKETFCAVITAAKIANKLASKYKKTPTYSQGEELVIKFPLSDLNNIIKLLKIPKSTRTQIRYAETFPEGFINEK